MTSFEAATVAELDALEDIERHSFARPTSREAFVAELGRDQARIYIARERGRVVGFCNVWIVVDELHVLSVAIHPDHRRAGLGARLLAHVLDAARATGCSVATLEVRRGNRPAIALYERAGFHTVNIRAGYYQDNHEDALVMLLALTPRDR
ncbi:MAG: ribosomal protein S18-alanine N-acetyltransferase [Kofleriaceae bacterium]